MTKTYTLKILNFLNTKKFRCINPKPKQIRHTIAKCLSDADGMENSEDSDQTALLLTLFT